MIEAAMLSLLSALPVRSTLRAGGSELSYSDQFVFAPFETLLGEVQASEDVQVLADAAVSGVTPEAREGWGSLGSPASGRFESFQEGGPAFLLARFGREPLDRFAHPGAFAQTVQASDLVDAIERTAGAGDQSATLALIQATINHVSSAVRASAVEAAERLLPTHPRLIARLSWVRRADPSPAVRMVAGEVLDYLD